MGIWNMALSVVLEISQLVEGVAIMGPPAPPTPPMGAPPPGGRIMAVTEGRCITLLLAEGGGAIEGGGAMEGGVAATGAGPGAVNDPLCMVIEALGCAAAGGGAEGG